MFRQDSREDMTMFDNTSPHEIHASRKIGQNRGKARLWIEGSLLIDAGLDHGHRWNIEHNESGFTITESPEGKRKVAGKVGRPIIDIASTGLGVVANASSVQLSHIRKSGVIRVTIQGA